MAYPSRQLGKSPLFDGVLGVITKDSSRYAKTLGAGRNYLVARRDFLAGNVDIRRGSGGIAILRCRLTSHEHVVSRVGSRGRRRKGTHNRSGIELHHCG